MCAYDSVACAMLTTMIGIDLRAARVTWTVFLSHSQYG